MSEMPRRRALATGLAALTGLALPDLALPGLAAAQTSRFGTIARRESQYNTIFIDQQGPYVAMRFGVNQYIFTESLYNPADPDEMPVVYTRYLTAGLAYTRQATKVLEIGLGGGRTASYLHDFFPSVSVTCVELDPEVINFARQYFGVHESPRLQLIERDGRIFTRATRDSYDMIIVDAYRGTFVPFHLTTREFFTVVKRKLNPGGVMTQNISPDVLNEADMTATLKSVFAHVDRYQADGNVVMMAYDGPPKTAAQLNARAAALPTSKPLRYPLQHMLSQRRANIARGGGRVLTDDFAPVEFQGAITRGNQRRDR